MSKQTWTIPESEQGKRIDAVVHSAFPQLSRGHIQSFIKQKKVLVGGRAVKSSLRLAVGDIVEALFTDAELATGLLADSSVVFDVVFECPDYIVVDKPAGVAVHPDRVGKNGTLVNGVIARYPEIAKVGEDALRPGIVQRLDRAVSGVMVIARTQKMFEQLKAEWQGRGVEKHYIALVSGHLPEDAGIVRSFMRRSNRHALKMVSDPDASRGGKEAITEYSVETTWPSYQLVRVTTHTGRMHQIRVHLASMGCPIVGDALYAPKGVGTKILSGRIFLHAQTLAFHDASGMRQEYTAPLPPELSDLLSGLKGGTHPPVSRTP